MLAVVMLLTGGIMPAKASGNNGPGGETFPIGIFWPPVWAFTNAEQYGYIKDANIDYIQNVSSTDLDTVEKNIAMLDLAQSVGLKVQVSDSRTKRILELADEELAEMVSDYKDHPATYGYYVKDEPTPSELEAFAAVYKKVRQLDPARNPSVNLLPKTWAIPNYKGYVEGWIQAVGASNLKLLSFDFYPFPVSPSDSVSEDYYVTLEHIKEAGLKYGLDTAGYLQSFGIPDVYRRPTTDEMRYNVYTMLAYGVKNPIWFTWWTPRSQAETFDDGIIDVDGNKTDFYEPVKQFNADMKNLGRTLIHLDAKYVYHHGAAQKGTKTVPEDFIMLPQKPANKPEDNLILTYFSNRTSGFNYVMVVNKSLTESKTVTFQMDPTLDASAIKEINAASEGNEMTPAFDAALNTVSADFLPGEGKLFKLPLGYTYTETADQSNVLPNGGFEQGLWPVHKGAVLDQSVRRKGQSAKLTASSSQAYVESAAAKIGRENGHSFSIWLRTDNVSTPNGVKVELMQVDANGLDTVAYPQTITAGGTTGWTKYEIPNVQTTASGIRVIVKTLPGVTGSVWADEAVLTDESASQTLIDEMVGFDNIFERSANFWFDGSNTHVADGDDSRLIRTTDTDEYIVYHLDSINSFEAKFYSGNTVGVQFYASSDNADWSPVAVNDRNVKNTSDGWFTVTKASQQIPPGTNYLKVVLLGSNEYNWYPQLGQMKITYGYNAEDNGLIDNGGFENGLWAMQRGALLDTSEKHSGSASAKIEAGASSQWISSSIATPDPTQKHDLSLWLKSDGFADPTAVRVELMQVDAHGNDVGLIADANGWLETGGTQGWTKYTMDGVRIQAPHVRVIVRTAAGAAGTVWVDDVMLEDLQVYGTLTDELNNFDNVVSKSSNIWLDAMNPDIADGDESRLTRTADTDEYLIYHKESISKFSAQLYTGSTDYVDFYVSPDQADWTKVEVDTSERVATNRGWYKLTKSSVGVPAGMNYLKMVVRGDNEFSWYPQVGSVSITSGYGDDVFAPPANLLRNAGFELDMWRDRQGASLELNDRHGGEASAKITAGAAENYVQSYPARVDSEQAYALSLWMKTDQISHPNGVRVEIAELDYEGNTIGTYVPKGGAVTTGGTKDWAPFSIPVIYPLQPAAASLKVKVLTEAGATGSVYVDDLMLAATDVPDPEAENPSGPGPGNGGGTAVTAPTTPDPSIQPVTESQLKQSDGTITLQTGKQKLSIPINAGEWLQNGNLIVKAGDASVAIPSSVLKALQEQAKKEALDATSIIVKVVPASMTADAGDTSLKAGGTAYVLELYAVNDQGKSTRLSSFQEAVHIELPYFATQDAGLIGIYYYNEASRKWEYVGGTVDAGKKVISTELRHFSEYAVMEYDKAFVDVPLTHWASKAIKALAAKHVVSGVDDSRFHPAGQTSRAQFTAMLVRALGIKPTAITPSFKDVASDKWYYEDVQSAYGAGLVQGVSDERFAPDAQITREQMAALMVRAAAYAKRESMSANAGLGGYEDKGKVSGWAAESVDQAIRSGLMLGKKSGYFAPLDRVTRAETAQAIWNLVK